MKNKIFTIICISIGVLLEINAFAQSDENLGVQEIQVTESFIPDVPEANKLTDIPTLSDTIKTVKNVSYSPINKRFESQLKLNPIKAAKIKGEPLNKLYHTYIYGGLGNMSMPTSKLFYSSDRNKSISYGLSLSYIESYSDVKSAFDEEIKVSAAFRETDFSAFLKKDFEFGIVNAYASRQGNMFQAYGYDPSLNLEEKFTEEYWGYSTVSLSLQSKNTDKSKASYYAKLFAYDLNEQTENSISFLLTAKQSVGLNAYTVDLGMDYDFNNLSKKYVFADSLAKELIITFHPSVSRELAGGDLNLGFELKSMDTRDSADISLVVFPHVRYDYVFSDNFQRAFIGVRGGLDENSYWTLSKKNPFILNALTTDGGSLELINSQIKYDFYVGMNSYLGSDVNWSSELSYARVQDMSFFELDPHSLYQNKFKVVYDNVNHLQWSSTLDWDVNPNANVNLQLNYHKYDLDSLQEYAYKPAIISKLGFSYDIGDKILPQIELVGAFDRSTASDSSSATPILNDIVDVNLALEYKYNTIFSAYFKAKNLIGGYQIWENYPVLGPQVFFGLSFRF
tara:strand:+ start:1785 stop:3482 length:1698 start_codon:yes stop_codon:yes gene_type:complete